MNRFYSNYKKRSVNERVFINSLLVAIIIPTFIAIQILYYQYPVKNLITWISMLLFSGICFYLYIHDKFHEIIHFIFFFTCIFILLPFGWSFSALVSPFPIVFSFIALLGVCNLFTGKKRVFFIVSDIAVSLIMLLIQAYYPESFPEVTKRQLIQDYVVQTPMLILIAASMAITFANTLRSQNEQLETLLEEQKKYTKLLGSQKEELEAQNEELFLQREKLSDNNDILNNQKLEIKAQYLQIVYKEQQLVELNQDYLSRSMNLQNLLNNIGQGFFCFGANFKIDSEYSMECERMLEITPGERLDLMKITDTLLLKDEEEDFITELLDKIFTDSIEKRELYISLLPAEINIGNKFLKAEYKSFINNDNEPRILVVLTDITGTKILESQLEKERKILNMLVKVLVNKVDFISMLSDYQDFIENEFSRIKDNNIEEYLREVHTYKGIFLQYYFENTADFLNELEEKLSQQVISDRLTLGIVEFNEIVAEAKAVLNLDMVSVERYIGYDLFEEDKFYSITHNRILNLENKVTQLLPFRAQERILPEIRTLRYKSIDSILGGYKDYVKLLGDRMDKPIKDLLIEGDEIFIDYNIYKEFFRSIVHLFRNSIDHGIEEQEERLVAEKPMNATIKCFIIDKKTEFEIIIEDDGRGILLEEVKRRAKQLGYYTEKEISKMTREEVLGIIFKSGFSTKDQVTLISGRGVGLSAVLYEIEKLDGKIKVESKPGVGTRFMISIPRKEEFVKHYVDYKEVYEYIIESGEKFFDFLKMQFIKEEVKEVEKVHLNEICCLIGSKGNANLLVVISITEKLAKDLVHAFTLEDVDESSLDMYIEDVLGEMANTIFGNTFEKFERKDIYLEIGIPTILKSSNATIKNMQSSILSTNFIKGKESVNISLLYIEDNKVLNDYWIEE